MSDCSGIEDGCYERCSWIYCEYCEISDHACRHESCGEGGRMTPAECATVLAQEGWAAEIAANTGIWSVGPQTSEGLLDVWGQGPELSDAINEAMKAIETSKREHGIQA